MDDDFEWNLWYARVLCMNAMPGKALRYARAAAALNGQSEDAQGILRECSLLKDLPTVFDNFAGRIGEMEELLENLASPEDPDDPDMMDLDIFEIRPGSREWSALRTVLQKTFRVMVHDADMDLEKDGSNFRLICSPRGNLETLEQLVFLKNELEYGVPDCWKVQVGFPRDPEYVPVFRGRAIPPQNIQVWTSPPESRRGPVTLKIYHDRLVGMGVTGEDEEVRRMVDRHLGEIVSLRLIDRIEVSPEPLSGLAGTLADLYDSLTLQGLDMSPDAVRVLMDQKRSWSADSLDPPAIPPDSLRLDIQEGVSRALYLEQEYRRGDVTTVDKMFRDGVAVGYLTFPRSMLRREDRRGLYRFWDKLQDSTDYWPCATLVGWALGSERAYLDLFVWNARVFLGQVGEFRRKKKLEDLEFRLFRADAGPVDLDDYFEKYRHIQSLFENAEDLDEDDEDEDEDDFGYQDDDALFDDDDEDDDEDWDDDDDEDDDEDWDDDDEDWEDEEDDDEDWDDDDDEDWDDDEDGDENWEDDVDVIWDDDDEDEDDDDDDDDDVEYDEDDEIFNLIFSRGDSDLPFKSWDEFDAFISGNIPEYVEDDDDDDDEDDDDDDDDVLEALAEDLWEEDDEGDEDDEEDDEEEWEDDDDEEDDEEDEDDDEI